MITPPYILSFTVGGLFLFEGIEMARMRRSGLSWDEVRRAAPGEVFVAKGSASSVKRIRNEVIGRLCLLDDAEHTQLAEAGMTDARALMWVATGLVSTQTPPPARPADHLDQSRRNHGGPQIAVTMPHFGKPLHPLVGKRLRRTIVQQGNLHV